jgi:hypothetical protein
MDGRNWAGRKVGMNWRGKWKKEKGENESMTSFKLNFKRTPAIAVSPRVIRWNVAKNWAEETEIEIAASNSTTDGTIET